jgi:hypothetical protein
MSRLQEVLIEVREVRALLKQTVDDHEKRLRVLERKNLLASSLVSAVSSLVVAAIYAGCVA